MPEVAAGRWQDAYVAKAGKSKVHLAGDDTTKAALCGAPVKPWTRPDPDSQICERGLTKAHRPHRDHIAATGRANKRKGLAPPPGQTDITTVPAPLANRRKQS